MSAPKGNQNATKPADEKLTATLFIRIPPETKTALVHMASRQKTTVNDYVREILEAHIKGKN